MAKIIGAFNEAEFERWLETRPEIVQDLGRRVRPDTLYRIGSTGHRCYVYSYREDGTVTVVVDGRFNRVAFSRRVSGIKPEDLTECDLPAPGEDVGDSAQEAGYTEADVRAVLIPEIRRRMTEGEEP